MPNVDISSLTLCLQALDTAVRYHEQFAKSETVDSDDDAELIFAYEREIQRLGSLYEAEQKRHPDYPPLKDLLPYTTERDQSAG
jgi:hypothetical protein